MASSTASSPEVKEKKTTAPYGAWKSPIIADVIYLSSAPRNVLVTFPPTHSTSSCSNHALLNQGNEKDYFERSPINFDDKFSCPIILFQGLNDKVVPSDQASKIYVALKKKGSLVALAEYEGEQHGFRKQMVFFARFVGHFKGADEVSPIRIDNFH